MHANKYKQTMQVNASKRKQMQAEVEAEVEAEVQAEVQAEVEAEVQAEVCVCKRKQANRVFAS